MIVRLLDKKGFTKLVEHPARNRNINIIYCVKFNNLQEMLKKNSKLDPNNSMDWMTTIEFKYWDRIDHDGYPIFEEI